MTGAFGHVSHLYEDMNLTFGELDAIMHGILDGEIETFEKFDGQNLVFTWNLENDELRVARNKGDLQNGGMNRSQLFNKFENRSTLQESFVSGFDALHSV